MRTRSWPHILLNNGPGEVLLHTNRRWIGWCADLKRKSSRDSSYFMVLCQVCRCFHGFSVFSSVFNKTISKQQTRHLKLLLLASSKRAFLAKKQQRQEVIHSPWHLMGTFWGHLFGLFETTTVSTCLANFQFYSNTVAFVDSSRPKQEKLQTVRWHLPWRRKRFWKSTVGWNHGENVLMGENMEEKNPWRIYILYIYNISQKFNMFQWFNLMRFGPSTCQQYALGIAVGGFHGGSGGEQLLVQSYNLMSVTWRINLKPFYMWLMWPFCIFP